MSLREKLHLKKILVDNILLDPNNPRFFELGIRRERVPEERVAEPGVQEDALLKIIRKFGARSIRDSILRVGFLPLDKIVVRPFTIQKGKYVIIEGNRRLAAIKWILNDCKSGELTLSDDDINGLGLRELEAYELRISPKEVEAHHLMIQGIRHISGVRGWKSYPRAQAVVAMLNLGFTEEETGEALGGLRPGDVIRYKRTFYAYRQMTENDEFGKIASEHPDWMGYFESTVGSRYLRDWLEWDDKTLQFTNEENLNTFYSWLVSRDEGGLGKIERMTDIRKLPKILRDSYVGKIFFDDPETTVDEASAIIIARQIRVDWRHDLLRAREALDRYVSLPFTEADHNLVQEIIKLANKRSKEIEKVIGKRKRKK